MAAVDPSDKLCTSPIHSQKRIDNDNDEPEVVEDTNGRVRRHFILSSKAGIVPYEHQVGGHKLDIARGRNPREVLRYPGMGTILKPTLSGQRGKIEENFYHHLQQIPTCRIHEVVPKFFGVAVLDEENNEYICLEDVTRGFSRPCIADIKIGKQTFTPNASAEKKSRDSLKYPWQSVIGFRLVGMKVFDRVLGSYRLYDKNFGKQLTDETISEGLRSFFDVGLRNEKYLDSLVGHLLKQMRNVQEVIQEYDWFNFYSSSLLVVYEGDPIRASASCCRVVMIDFGHAIPNSRMATTEPSSRSRDENYLFGLSSLIRKLEEMDFSSDIDYSSLPALVSLSPLPPSSLT